MSTASAQPSKPRTRELFLAALERPAAARGAFLDAECGSDRGLREQVESLLRSQDTVGSFLETPAVSNASGASAANARGPHDTEVVASVSEKPGDLIGPYKLLEQIGEGGCGVVYMAEQEKPVRRRVALKVIKLGMDTKNVIARFEAERQALALMEHPNIARVLDAGATQTGRPYFVMELVRGVRITQYCDENQLPTEARLKLFIQVCHAIQHAHQKGIIHRDIKPSNILVTLHDGVPVPKVIDFGIAKATGQKLTEKTLFTQFQSFIGTPAYMSPEQAEMSGLDIDTRSDIYSLGVLLYELLVGRTPFDAETLWRAGLDECRRTIREDEPARPSTRLSTLGGADLTTTAGQRQTDASRLVRQLRGDLDWIAMKCLEKDRSRRYETANGVAMDIQRYLGGEPVLARPPSNVYRLQKFYRRNRIVMIATGAVAATLVIGAGISAWLAVRAMRAERAAQASEREEFVQRQQAERGKTSARLNEYVAHITLAQQALVSGNYGRAVQLLNSHLPKSGEPDLRGFEWRYLRHASRGDKHTTLPNQNSDVMSLAISPAGDLLAVGLREKFNVWNLRTKALVTSVPKGVNSMAFSPDGRRLYTTAIAHVRTWNTTDWREEKTLSDNGGTLALSPDGRQLATVSRRGVHLWDTLSWDETRVLEGASGPLAFSRDGNSLVAESRAGLAVWSLKVPQGEVVLHDSTNLFPRGPALRFRGDHRLDFSPDGRHVIAARNTLSERGVFVLSLWDAATGQELAAIPNDAEHIEHAGVITSLAFSPDGRTLATASMDHSIRLWDFTKREPVAALHGHLSEVMALTFSPDGQSIISGAQDGDVKIWPAQPKRQDDIVTGVRHPLGFSRDGRRLAGVTRDGSSVVFVNVATHEPEQQFPLENRRGRFGPPMPVAISDDLRTLAQGLEDGTVRLLDTVTSEATSIKVSEGPVEMVALAPDGALLITRGRDRATHRWDLHTGSNNVWQVDASRFLFSRTGRLLATAGRGNDVQLWDTPTLSPRAKLSCEEPPVFGFPAFLVAAFSADDRLLAVAYQDDVIRLWDTTTGKLAGACTGHKQDVRSLAFAPDGRTLASTSDDSTLKWWHVATQQELVSIRQLGATLSGLLFSPDGQLLVGGSGAFSPTGGLRFFRAPNE